MTAPVALERFRPLFDGLDEPEGVAVADDGAVWCGGRAGQVYRGRIDVPGGTFGLLENAEEVARLPGRVLGFALDAAGNAYCCCLGNAPGVFRVTPAGAVERVLGELPGHRLVAPNHPAFLPDGRLVVTDSGHEASIDGRLLAVAPDGTASVVSDSVRRYPNGLAVSPNRSVLAVVESDLPGVVALELRRDGGLGPARMMARLPATVPDGVAFDARGRLLVSCFTPSRIWLLHGDRVHVLADDPDERVLRGPTNVAFVPGTNTVVCAALRGTTLAVFEHDTRGSALVRPPRFGG